MSSIELLNQRMRCYRDLQYAFLRRVEEAKVRGTISNLRGTHDPMMCCASVKLL